MTTVQDTGIDIKALNATTQAAVVPLFWGALAMVVLAPVAAAAGGWVSEKVFKSDKKKTPQ